MRTQPVGIGVSLDALPDDDEFTLEDRPSGMPTNKEARFKKFKDGDRVSLRNVYLVVQPARGELLVARVQKMQTPSGETSYSAVPYNEVTGVGPFDITVDDIMATLIS